MTAGRNQVLQVIACNDRRTKPGSPGHRLQRWRGAPRAGLATVPPVSRRDQIQMTDDDVAGFLDEERTVICATIGRDGFPHLMPLWFVMRDREIWSWTFAKSQKVRNLERDPRATVEVEAGTEYDQLRGVMLKTNVTIHRDTSVVEKLGMELFDRYRADDAIPPTRCRTRFARWSARSRPNAWRCSSSSVAGRRGITASSRPACTEHERPDPLRRQGHAPAADHPHERQAARAGRQQARPLLRHRGDGRGRDRGGRHHHRAETGDEIRDGRRRRVALRRAHHLRRAGRAARPRARGADRRGVPGDSTVRHVPRRQPAAGRHRRPRRGLPGSASPTR